MPASTNLVLIERWFKFRLYGTMLINRDCASHFEHLKRSGGEGIKKFSHHLLENRKEIHEGTCKPGIALCNDTSTAQGTYIKAPIQRAKPSIICAL